MFQLKEVPRNKTFHKNILARKFSLIVQLNVNRLSDQTSDQNMTWEHLHNSLSIVQLRQGTQRKWLNRQKHVSRQPDWIMALLGVKCSN